MELTSKKEDQKFEIMKFLEIEEIQQKKNVIPVIQNTEIST